MQSKKPSTCGFYIIMVMYENYTVRRQLKFISRHDTYTLQAASHALVFLFGFNIYELATCQAAAAAAAVLPSMQAPRETLFDDDVHWNGRECEALRIIRGGHVLNHGP